MRANLLNEPKKSVTDRWKPLLALILVIVVTAGLANSFFQARRTVFSLQEELRGLNQQVIEIGSKRQEYQELQEKIKALQTRSAYYFWDKVIREQGYLVSESTTLKQLTISGSKLSITGFSAGREDFLQYLENFYASSIFRSVNINYLNRQEELKFKLDAEIAAGDQ